MKIIRSSYSPYTLKFKQPFLTSKGELKERKGFLIKLDSETGKNGFGDACPLADFGSESYEQAEKILKELELKIRIDLSDIEKSIFETLEPLNNFPSLRHGFEQAILNLISRDQITSLNEILNAKSKKIINVNAVIGILSAEETILKAKELIEMGYKTLKLKVGRNDFGDDINCLEALRKSIVHNIKIRLDVNGKWNLSEAISNLNRLNNLNIEYIEQPVSTLQEFLELSPKTNLPLAADESIRSLKSAYDFISQKAASVLILKPMLLGGIIPTLKIIEFAQQNKIKTVITTSFESCLGKSFAVLAASFTKGEWAHGLSTENLFEKDLFPDPYPVKNGQIVLSE